jgi:hypothetical protein
MNQPQDSEKSAPFSKLFESLRANANYIIIGLLAIIAVGVVYLIFSNGGKESVEVTSFSPTDEVPQTTNFTVEFSKPPVSDSLLNMQLDQAAIAFNPAISGKFRWIESNKLRFYPDNLLAPSTEYTAEISPRIANGSGYSLSGDTEFHFRTARLQVTSAFLTFEFRADIQQEANLRGSIEFNYEVDPAEAAKFITIRGAGGETIPYEIVTNQPNKILALEANRVKRGEKESEIKLRVAEGMPCIGGTLGLERDFEKPVVLPGQEDLKVTQITAKKESRTKGWIQVQFNLPVQYENVREHISVDPQVKFTVTVSHRSLELRGDFEMDKAYQVSLSKDLRAVDGTPLKKYFSSAVTFRKERIPSQVGFVGDGFYLTRGGNLNVGLSTINVSKVSLEVEKVYANNVVYLLNQTDLSHSWYGYYQMEALGKQIYESDMVVQESENEEVVTPLSVRDYLGDERKGIFRLTARMTEQRWMDASKWVIATDLGMIAKKGGDDLWVWVNSLSTLQPIQNAELTLLSQNNQTLMTATTNADGVAIFSTKRPGIRQNYAGFTDEFDPYLITATYGEDLSFVELERRRIPTSDFDVDGQPFLEHGYDAFVYNERGVYRPGETAHLAAVIRGENTTVPTPFPVKLRVNGPDGKILEEQRATLNAPGAADFSVVIPDYVLTGKYWAMLLIGDDDEIGRTSFNVEEFVPDRMKVKVSTDRESYFAGEKMDIAVEGVTLFGPPASGRQVQGTVEIEPYPFSSANWKSFTFSDEKKDFAKLNFDLDVQTLDAAGKYTYQFTIPQDLHPPSSLRGIVETTVLEPGGRGVTAYRAVNIHPYRTYVGLRQAKEGYAAPNEATKIDFVVLNPDAEPVPARQVEVSFYRIYWHSILKRVEGSGRYRYVSEQVEELSQQFNVTSDGAASSFSVTPGDYGEYRVAARDVNSGASASISFYASGWGYSPWAMDHPDRIDLDLDKEMYAPGENAKIQIRAPFPGKLFLSIEREKVFEYKVLNLAENTATVELPVGNSYKPNVYISAHLVRSTESLERDTPARAFGVVPLMVNSDANRLNVELDMPAEIRPKKNLNVKLRVTGQSNSTPYVTIAAVDEGICQLTDFQTPDPHGHFFGKKRLGVESFDIYGMVLPEIESSLTSASGDVEAARKRQLSPVTVRRVKPVAFWTGLIKTDGKGRGEANFQLPQFNGSVRVMAVAFAGDKFGNAQKNIFVREPIVITPTFPRFIASTDEFVVPVGVYNGTAAENNFEIKLSIDGPVKLVSESAQTIKIAKGSENQVYFKARAERAMGKVTFRVSASGGGEQTQMSEDVPLRPPAPFITLAGNGYVAENKPAKFTFPADWLEGTGDFSLTLSAFPAVNFTGSLQYLLGYPHGCVEQTTSKVFPLLYFNDLAKVAEPELFKTTSVDYFIEQGIAKLENMQLTSGAFSYWPTGGYINNWSSVYAAHFLVEARRAGHVVSDRVYDRLIDAMRNTARDYRADNDYSYSTAAYACYVLALAGKPEKSTMLYLKNSAGSKLRAYSQYQLAGAFALSGDLRTAQTMLPKTVVPVSETNWESGGNFDSSARNQAIMLDILAEVDDRHPMAPVLVENLTAAASKFGRWYNTQENAFAFLALGKILRKKGDGGKFTGTVTIAGREYGQFTEQNQTFTSKNWAGNEAIIAIKGTGTCYYYWKAEGISANLSVDEYDNDLMVRRRYLDEHGNAIDYSTFKQGEMVIAEITVKPLTESLDNVAIVDLLPAGLEIENPRMQSRKGIDWISKEAYTPMYMDIRDDRMIIYGNFGHNRTERFYYGLRAVTQGTFILPPIRGEAMYAPTKASVASSGKIVVGQ